MGLLNRILGSKKSVAEEVDKDIKQIKKIWQNYESTYNSKRELIKLIHFGSQPLTEKLRFLHEIESLILGELVDSGAHEKKVQKADAPVKLEDLAKEAEQKTTKTTKKKIAGDKGAEGAAPVNSKAKLKRQSLIA